MGGLIVERKGNLWYKFSNGELQAFVVLCSVFYVASDASLLTCLLSFVLVHCSADCTPLLWMFCIHILCHWYLMLSMFDSNINEQQIYTQGFINCKYHLPCEFRNSLSDCNQDSNLSLLHFNVRSLVKTTITVLSFYLPCSMIFPLLVSQKPG